MKRTHILIVILWLIYPPLSLFSDEIITIVEKNSLRDVTVTKETFDKIEYYFTKFSSQTRQTIDTGKVKEIRREQYPVDYQAAESAMSGESYTRAIELFNRSASNQDWTEQHSYFKIALCYQKMNDLGKATGSYKNLLKKFPDTYYKAEAYYNMGHCYLTGRKLKNAYEMIEFAAKLYGQIQKEPSWIECHYWLGMISERGKQWKTASEKYKVVAKSSGFPEFQNKARLGLANCHAAQSNWSEAKEIWLSFIQDGDPSNQENFGGAYLGLGNYYFENRKVKESLLCYLRVVLMYPQSGYLREAASKGAYCFELLKDENSEYINHAQKLKAMAKE